MVKKRSKMIYRYECTITGEMFKTTRQAPQANELMSVRAFYELNPDKDDRPDYIKKQLEQEYEEEKARQAELAALQAAQQGQGTEH